MKCTWFGILENSPKPHQHCPTLSKKYNICSTLKTFRTWKETSIDWKLKDKFFSLFFEQPSQHNCCLTVLWKFYLRHIYGYIEIVRNCVVDKNYWYCSHQSTDFNTNYRMILLIKLFVTSQLKLFKIDPSREICSYVTWVKPFFVW